MTDLPGWSVQDNVSHIVDIEQRLDGRPGPEHTPADLSHTRSEFGALNEVGVDWRRSRTGAEVLEEFRTTTSERLARFRAYGPDDFEADSWTPLGPGKVRDLLPIRTLDCWVHEQDIRRALGRPGHTSGPAAETALDRLFGAFGYVVGKKAGVPEGTVVRLSVEGSRTVTVGMTDGRAGPAPDDAEPDAEIVCDLPTYIALATGRWDRSTALQRGVLKLGGDEDMAGRVADALNVMP